MFQYLASLITIESISGPTIVVDPIKMSVVVSKITPDKDTTEIVDVAPV